MKKQFSLGAVLAGHLESLLDRPAQRERGVCVQYNSRARAHSLSRVLSYKIFTEHGARVVVFCMEVKQVFSGIAATLPS